MSDSFTRAPADSVEATRDLQDRLGQFARTTFVVSGVMLIASVGLDLAAGMGAAGMSRSSRVVHLVAQALLFVVWRIGRGKALGVPVIHALDTIMTIILCATWALLGLGVPETEPIEFAIILATSYTLIARSVVIPSSCGRTFWIGVPSVLPTIVVFARRGMPFVPGASPERVRTFLVFSTLWCVVAVCTAALNSRLLYGLRRHIREVSKLGQYTLAEKLGEGGMGVVYRATHAMLRRPAAVKLLLPGRTAERDLVRFEREVQLTCRLTHPNTISIFDYGRTTDGIFYYVMEYLDGIDLDRLIDREGPLAPTRVIRILAQASGALAEAHAQGLVHRDVKPANIILTRRADELDIVKVVDFGLVRTLETRPGELDVTQANSITGTPMYLAPEAITAPDSVDGRADLYALGAVGYFLVTGRQVFEATSVLEICTKHLLEVPLSPSQRIGHPLPLDLERLILACLEKSPERRPASAKSLRASLLACADAARDDSEQLSRWWEEQGRNRQVREEAPHPHERSETMPISLRPRALALGA